MLVVMTWKFEPRFCARCGMAIPQEIRADASFYPRSCKVAWMRARQATRESKELLAFEDRIDRYRPIAHWYRLAIRIQGRASLYPITKKPSLRFDGVQRLSPGFRIDPYEPPVVPIAGQYHVVLADANGRRVPLPKGEGGASLIVPCQALNVEDGEPGN
jgi:hypothetical protein